MGEKKKLPDDSSSEDMEFRGQRDTGNYSGAYQPVYMPDMSASFMPASQYSADSRNNAALINPKQIYWIRKRQLRRELLDSVMVQQNKNYMHESRHRHAMKRLRAPSGRFLTKEETAEIRRNERMSQHGNRDDRGM